MPMKYLGGVLTVVCVSHPVCGGLKSTMVKRRLIIKGVPDHNLIVCSCTNCGYMEFYDSPLAPSSSLP